MAAAADGAAATAASLVRSFVAFDLFLCKLYVTFIRRRRMCTSYNPARYIA